MKTVSYKHGESTTQIEVENSSNYYMFLEVSTETPTSYTGNSGEVTITGRKVVAAKGSYSVEFDFSDVIVDNLGNEYAKAIG